MSQEITSQNLNTSIEAFKKSGIIPSHASPADCQLFALTASKYGLDPVRKEIYLVPFGKKLVTMVGIDGARVIANRNSDFAGVQVTFNGGKSIFDAKKESAKPSTAECSIKKLIGNQVLEFTRTEVSLEEFAKGDTYGKMPFVMLGKVAEMRAYKIAFPEAMNGIHVEGEEGAFEIVNEVVTGPAAELPKPTPAQLTQIQRRVLLDLSKASSVLDMAKNHYDLSEEQIKQFDALIARQLDDAAQSQPQDEA